MRVPGKGNSSSYGSRPVYQIISMIEWMRTSRLSIKNILSLGGWGGLVAFFLGDALAVRARKLPL